MELSKIILGMVPSSLNIVRISIFKDFRSIIFSGNRLNLKYKGAGGIRRQPLKFSLKNHQGGYKIDTPVNKAIGTHGFRQFPQPRRLSQFEMASKMTLSSSRSPSPLASLASFPAANIITMSVSELAEVSI